MTNFQQEFDILITLFRNLSVVVAFSYLLVRTNLFKKFFYKPLVLRDKIFLIIFLGSFSITGTYLGINIMDAYANMRSIWAVVAGLLGGPVVGLLAGAIGGLHRYTLGGFTALACAIGTINSGFLGGLFHKKYKKQELTALNAFYIGLGLLVIEMILVIIFSRPLMQAVKLVAIIGLPMVLTNAVGISIFVSILNSVKRETENIRAEQAKTVLEIASRTLSHISKIKSNQKAAEKAAEIILEMVEVDAVAITDREKILAFKGKGADHHREGQPYITRVTKEVMQTGRVAIGTSKSDIGCPEDSCPLQSVVVSPLKWEDKVMGVIKLYKINNKLTQVDISLARGIASLLSTQLQLVRLSEQAKLKTQAELRALQAQVNPHFLFNSLNTISSFIRTDPEKARELIIKLSSFFRSTLCKGHDLIKLKQEIKSVYNYYFLEKARFGDNIKLVIDLSDNLENLLVPSFTLQPIVENSIKHGLYPNQKGLIEIMGDIENNNLILKVRDNGRGIPEEIADNVLESGCGEGSGIGLSNVNERIKNLFGPEFGLQINQQIKKGTEVIINLPVKVVNENRTQGISS